MAAGANPAFTTAEAEGGVLLTASGDWIVSRLAGIDREIRGFAAPTTAGRSAIIDISDVGRLDTAGAWLIHSLEQSLQGAGLDVKLVGGSDDDLSLIKEVRRNDEPTETEIEPLPLHLHIANEVGQAMVFVWNDMTGLVNFLGLSLSTLARDLVQPYRLRFTSVVYQMEHTGLNALPIICLINFLIGSVVAQQGAAQLRNFGADVFAVNLVAIIMLREGAILLTAIMVAGRSGSAFTAQIGSMKANEEIDAMRTLGLDPIEMLVVPRLLALIIMLPILTFVGGVLSLVGGALALWVVGEISPGMFLVRAEEAVTLAHFLVGIVKAPFMAIIIATVGCYSGMQVTGSAESVGQMTTRSVVASIFLVIVVNALFAVFFTAMDI